MSCCGSMASVWSAVGDVLDSRLMRVGWVVGSVGSADSALMGGDSRVDAVRGSVVLGSSFTVVACDTELGTSVGGRSAGDGFSVSGAAVPAIVSACTRVTASAPSSCD